MNDFESTGTFRATVSEMWSKVRERDPTFGVKKPKSEIEFNDIGLINDKIPQDGTLKPYEDPKHLKLIVIFILLRFYGFRADDAHDITMDQVTIGTYDQGPDAGRRYILIKIDFDKVKKLKLSKSTIPRDYGKCSLRENNEDDEGFMDGFDILVFFFSKLQLGVGTKGKLLKQELRRDVTPKDKHWYTRQNVGINQITNVYRTLGAIMGTDKFDNITAHGGRICLITASLTAGVSPKAIIQQTRHATIASLSHYGQNNSVADSALQDSFASYYKSTAQRSSENAAKNKRKGPTQTSETAKRSKPPDESAMLRLERENHQLREELATFRAHLPHPAPPISHQTPIMNHQMMPPQPLQPPLSHYPMHQQQFQHYPYPPPASLPNYPDYPNHTDNRYRRRTISEWCTIS